MSVFSVKMLSTELLSLETRGQVSFDVCWTRLSSQEE